MLRKSLYVPRRCRDDSEYRLTACVAETLRAALCLPSWPVHADKVCSLSDEAGPGHIDDGATTEGRAKKMSADCLGALVALALLWHRHTTSLPMWSIARYGTTSLHQSTQAAQPWHAYLKLSVKRIMILLLVLLYDFACQARNDDPTKLLQGDSERGGTNFPDTFSRHTFLRGLPLTGQGQPQSGGAARVPSPETVAHQREHEDLFAISLSC